jgi:hypothetical protein
VSAARRPAPGGKSSADPDPACDWRLAHTLAVIDAANSIDPNWIYVRGRERPKELAHAELVSEWVLRLDPQASEALQLAARSHHLERWRIPRDSYPPGRSGYLRWRKQLQQYHAERTGILLAGEQCAEETILRVQELIRKRGLGRDPEVQTLEDAMCLVFLETQFSELAQRTATDTMIDITRKTLAKMSEAARYLALSFSLSERDLAIVRQAASSIPERASDAETKSPDGEPSVPSLP